MARGMVLVLLVLLGGAVDAGAAPSSDFNGDGIDDLAVGVPGESVGGNVSDELAWPFGAFRKPLTISDTRSPPETSTAMASRTWPSERSDGILIVGAVNVLYGTGGVFDGLRRESVLEPEQRAGRRAHPGAAEQLDFFGTSLAAGDFNGDGCADLAVGVPGESVEGVTDAGAVNVLYGSPEGLTAAGNQLWHQNSVQGGVAIEGVVEGSDNFGQALVAGDFNCDGVADLAVESATRVSTASSGPAQ